MRTHSILSAEHRPYFFFSSSVQVRVNILPHNQWLATGILLQAATVDLKLFCLFHSPQHMSLCIPGSRLSMRGYVLIYISLAVDPQSGMIAFLGQTLCNPFFFQKLYQKRPLSHNISRRERERERELSLIHISEPTRR